MHVLILTSVYLPDDAQDAKRMSNLANALKKEGHRVTVIAGFPHYPHGIVPEKYRGNVFVDEFADGIRVIRSYLYASPKKTTVRRLLNYSTFMFSSIFASFRIKEKVDVIVTIWPPLFVGIAAMVIGWLKKAPFIYDIEDLYPRTAVVHGIIGGPVARTLESIERLIYRKARRIVVISKGFKDHVVSKGVDGGKVDVIPNWAEENFFAEPDSTKDLKEQLELSGKFVVTYAGTIGYAQSLECIVRAADTLRDKRDIVFLVIGEGMDKQRLVAISEGLSLVNIRFLPWQSRHDIIGYLHSSDALLVHLKGDELYRVTIPSKVYEYMAVGKAVIAGLKGDALRLIEEIGCGIGFEPEDHEALAETVTELFYNREKCRMMGETGRRAAEDIYTRDKVVSDYVRVVEAAAVQARSIAPGINK